MIFCLATAVYNESRNQPEVTQLAVMSVVMNRGSDPCKTILEPHQFAFVKKGRIPPVKEPKTFKKIQKLVREGRPNLSKKYTFFNELRLGVRYKTDAKPVRLGKLIFY